MILDPAQIITLEQHMADRLFHARARCDSLASRPHTDTGQADAVTAWRQWSHLMTSYCGDHPVSLMMLHHNHTGSIAATLHRHSRARRSNAHGDALLYADSFNRWVWELHHYRDLYTRCLAAVFCNAEATRRITIEQGIVTDIIRHLPEHADIRV